MPTKHTYDSPHPAVDHLLPMFLDPATIAAVWERFCIPLHSVAARYLGMQVRTRIDAEDVVQSVYRTLYRRAKSTASAAAGPTPTTHPTKLDDSDSLWKLLVTVTIRKAINKRVTQLRLKRSVAATTSGEGPDWAGAATEPTPDEIAEQAESVANLKTSLIATFNHDLHKRIAALLLEGRNAAEIAALVGCVERTVYRVKRDLEEAAIGLLGVLEAEGTT